MSKSDPQRDKHNGAQPVEHADEATDATLRELRRQIRENARQIAEIALELDELARTQQDVLDSCRNANGVHQDVMELQVQVAELQEGQG